MEILASIMTGLTTIPGVYKRLQSDDRVEREALEGRSVFSLIHLSQTHLLRKKIKQLLKE